LRGVVDLQHILRNKISQLDRAIVTRELSAKLQKEVLKREPKTMLIPINTGDSGPLWAKVSPLAQGLLSKIAIIHYAAVYTVILRKIYLASSKCRRIFFARQVHAFAENIE
jgi:hypothetical protein